MRVLIFSLFISLVGIGQGIWKDHREMQDPERQEYIKVLNLLNTSGVRSNFINSHVNFAQHSDDNFLPWHRIMLYYFEREAKAVNKYFNQGYLNWFTDFVSSTSLLRNFSGGVGGLLGHSINWSFTRYATQVGGLAGIGVYSSDNFTRFRQDLQDYHDNGHVAIAGEFGIMSDIQYSPTDPAFYFHHAQVDKIWAEWTKIKWDGIDFGSVTNGNIPSLNSTSVYNGRQIFDPRTLKLWYADNGKVVLDKYTASHQTLGLTTGPEFYFYTGLITVAGTMANFFTVPAGIEAKIESLSEIAILPGFSAPDGSYFGASSIGAFPTTPGTIQRKEAPEEQTTNLLTMEIYPNPNDGTFKINLPEGELIFNMWITSALGNITNYIRKSDFEIELLNAPYGTYNVLIQSQSGKKYKGRVVVSY